MTASPAGTHIIEHAGRLLALCEANYPFELTADLDTVGAYDFSGKLRTAMTAHPKTDPVPTVPVRRGEGMKRLTALGDLLRHDAQGRQALPVRTTE